MASAHICRVLMMRRRDTDKRDALEHGYDHWECGWCGNYLGQCAGHGAVRVGQRCDCGALAVEVTWA